MLTFRFLPGTECRSLAPYEFRTCQCLDGFVEEPEDSAGSGLISGCRERTEAVEADEAVDLEASGDDDGDGNSTGGNGNAVGGSANAEFTDGCVHAVSYVMSFK